MPTSHLEMMILSSPYNTAIMTTGKNVLSFTECQALGGELVNLLTTVHKARLKIFPIPSLCSPPTFLGSYKFRLEFSFQYTTMPGVSRVVVKIKSDPPA